MFRIPLRTYSSAARVSRGPRPLTREQEGAGSSSPQGTGPARLTLPASCAIGSWRREAEFETTQLLLTARLALQLVAETYYIERSHDSIDWKRASLGVC